MAVVVANKEGAEAPWLVFPVSFSLQNTCFVVYLHT